MDIDLVPPTALSLPGRLAMSAAPGRTASLRDDLEDLRARHGIRVVVSLLPGYEREALRITDLPVLARALDLELIDLPIRDGGAPGVDQLAPVVFAVLGHLRAGTHVLVHCRGGFGRTGTVVAACLVGAGCAPDEAIAIVRLARPGTIETGPQEAIVRACARTRLA